MGKTAAVILLMSAAGPVGAGGQAPPTQAGKPSASVSAEATAAERLTEEQKTAIVAIRMETQREATPIAAELAGTVKESYENMLSEQLDPLAQEEFCKRAAASVARLITVANKGMQRGVGVLTPAQRQKVRAEMGKPGAPGDLLELIARVYELPSK